MSDDRPNLAAIQAMPIRRLLDVGPLKHAEALKHRILGGLVHVVPLFSDIEIGFGGDG